MIDLPRLFSQDLVYITRCGVAGWGSHGLLCRGRWPRLGQHEPIGNGFVGALMREGDTPSTTPPYPGVVTQAAPPGCPGVERPVA
jgi:hypothetical protein